MSIVVVDMMVKVIVGLGLKLSYVSVFNIEMIMIIGMKKVEIILVKWLIGGLEFCVCFIILMICVSVVFFLICVVLNIIMFDLFKVLVIILFFLVFLIGIGLFVSMDLLIEVCFFNIILLMGIFLFGFIFIILLSKICLILI